MIALLALGLAHAADAPPWDALLGDEGWSQLATPTSSSGHTVDLRLKEIGGIPCLRGEVRGVWSVASLMATAADIEGSPKFSSEKLHASEVLARTDRSMDYLQILDVPDWTMAADRFWVLRAEQFERGGGTGFRWQRFDWKAAYPQLATRLATDHADAVEPDPNWGAWLFTPVEGETLVRYHLCSNAGGSLPGWLQKAAATRTLPGTMGDLLLEATRRDVAR